MHASCGFDIDQLFISPRLKHLDWINDGNCTIKDKWLLDPVLGIRVNQLCPYGRLF